MRWHACDDSRDLAWSVVISRAISRAISRVRSRLTSRVISRDLAQGAFRMRGIGAGQSVSMMVIPEVGALMRRPLDRMQSQAAQTPVRNHNS